MKIHHIFSFLKILLSLTPDLKHVKDEEMHFSN